ncbi:amidase [Martelella mediterranea]|uniref:Glutamyl-tRNA(Gln) amidotransferase subunit A n=1 Tax=Martelella mediterranea DSM 17316 TaxID=1122214 RepID=A0A1U9Z3A6_9HYPH|nr:amidase [Martelella mediterranea]AQZ52177.1 Glutamyl-tRNA(Gln) amidotransferase subunit A [Martelella mediterranea DSM 17316]
MTQSIGPFVERFEPPVTAETPATDLLSGLTVAVKDNFDIAGTVTGGGNPEWAEDQTPAAHHAAAVQTLLENGAALVGKVHMDELAYSLMGMNARFGTPENPAAPSRVPGGSSSGSASAVASGLADIGLGSDTGGSVRLPASFCGLFGWRPTHGLVSGEGLLPLAESYDVPGFLTRELETLSLLGEIFADGQSADEDVRLVYPADVWRLCEDAAAAALKSALPKGDRNDSPLLPGGDLKELLPVFRTHQGYEVWQHFGSWIEKREPEFGPGIRERFAMAAKITPEEFEAAKKKRAAFRAHLGRVLSPGIIMVYPTSPGPAPLLTDGNDIIETFRSRALSMLAIAGHGGLPQVSIPLAASQGSPLGLSLVAAPGSDRLLIETAKRFI